MLPLITKLENDRKLAVGEVEPLAEAGDLQPGREETGGLGALSGRYDDEHGSSVSEP